MPSASLITLSHVCDDLGLGGGGLWRVQHHIKSLPVVPHITSPAYFLPLRQNKCLTVWSSALIIQAPSFNGFVQNFSIVSKWKLLFVLALEHESWQSLLAPFWRFNSLRLSLSIQDLTKSCINDSEIPFKNWLSWTKVFLLELWKGKFEYI